MLRSRFGRVADDNRRARTSSPAAQLQNGSVLGAAAAQRYSRSEVLPVLITDLSSGGVLFNRNRADRELDMTGIWNRTSPRIRRRSGARARRRDLLVAWLR